MTTGTMTIDGDKLYYEVAGEGETLVLTHAGFVDGGTWDDQWAAFTKHYRVVRYDMRGYGKSDPVKAPITRREDLLALVEHLKIERAAFVGLSMGGEITLDFALDNTEKVSALVLISATPSGFELKGDPPPNLMEMMEAVQKGDLERAAELQMRIWIDGMYRQPNEVEATVRKHAAAMSKIALKNGTFGITDAQPKNPLNPPAVGRLNEVKVPTLIIAGDLDHPEVVRGADFMQANIAGAKKHIISGAAHMPNMEKPEEFNRVVLGFLKS